MTAADKFRLSDHDLHLFREGTHRRLYERMGCQLGADRAHFAVWAPNARRVAVVGGGDGSGNFGGVDAVPAPAHGRFQSLTLTLPPLSTLFFTSADRAASR